MKTEPETTTSTEEAAKPCAEVYAEGAVFETRDELSAALCDRGGEVFLPGSVFKECRDGRTLFWNDEGWGYLGEPFHRHPAGGEQVAPEDERSTCEAD